ncbi:hypothetical protein PVAND_011782 [Polypedilum vanderplanki]|uniref:UBA domain-containing protein n=1 Tax=Polypedilum vanderplanki TaxID=319348 RepID=A0A9J6CKF2_POLVA|nr:hypothetical protein PVAND_011782 [Polypedilum vanderplanki]
MLPWLREKIALRRQRWLRSRNEEIKPQLSEIQDDIDIESTTSSELLNLKIIIPKLCIVLNLQVSYFDSCLQIKEKLLKKLESTQSPSRSISNDIHSFRLVRSYTKEPFQNFDSILSSNVKNNEEFILIIRRTNGQINQILNVHNQYGPTDREILNRTKNFPIVHSTISAALNMTLDSTFLQGDLQNDLRKILSEIAKYSAYILGSLPYAEKLIRYYRQKILYNLNNNSDIIKILSEMGFSKKNVIRALKLQGNNYTLALDWLVENVKEEEMEEERGQSESANSNMELSSESNEVEDENSVSDTYKKFYTKPYSSSNSIFYPKHKAISIKDRVKGLLEIVKYYSEKNEEPSTKADTINSLINMGFAMDEIERALEMTSNNQTAACEWLLEHSSNSQNINALRESIFVESHILKILLRTPQIQFSLSSPKFFIAFVSLLENYSSLNIFFNDLESHSLLQFILRTYHEEKIFYHTFDKLTTTTVTQPSTSSSASVT